MRCPYCHNSELVLSLPDNMRIPEEEVTAHLRKRRGVLKGLCITGGEPTLQPDLRDFIVKVKELGYLIKLDTNGLRPDVLAALLDEKLLDYVAVDIKAGRDNYAKVTGLSKGTRTDVTAVTTGGLTDKVSETVELLLSGDIEYELRTTVVKGLHTEEDFTDIRDWLEMLEKETGDVKIMNYYLQSYVYRDTVMDKNAGYDSYSAAELEAFRQILLPVTEQVFMRGIE